MNRCMLFQLPCHFQNKQLPVAQQIRTTARKAVIELQDSRALRKALLARPRVSRDFRPGDLVAYWRNQKMGQR